MSDDASTRFPFINLEKALARAQQLFDADRNGRPLPIVVIFELWGYSSKSSGGFQTIGALKYYGLLQDEGSNTDRRARLTDAARRYFLDERDQERAEMLAGFALNPALFRWLWTRDRWSDGIPADTVARSHLKIERGLNDQSARSILAIFKENIQFAGLKPRAVLLEPLDATHSDPVRSKGEQEPAEAPIISGVTEVPSPTVIGGPIEAIDARLVGDRVIISANVDLKGLRRLKKQIGLLEQMLTLKDDEDDEGIFS